jgi:hypothetical protein
MRLAWENENVSISLSGQNLASENHVEFGNKRIPRRVMGKLTLFF